MTCNFFIQQSLIKGRLIVEDYKDKIVFEFAGHTHDKQIRNFKDIMTVVETQANVEGPVTRIVQVYPDGKIDYSQLLPRKMMIVKSHSPVDLEIIDPDGLKINKQILRIWQKILN